MNIDQSNLELKLANLKFKLKTAEFDESKHPRDDDGKFSSGEGGGSGGTTDIDLEGSDSTSKISQKLESNSIGEKIPEFRELRGFGPSDSRDIVKSALGEDHEFSKRMFVDQDEFSEEELGKINAEIKKRDLKVTMIADEDGDTSHPGYIEGRIRDGSEISESIKETIRNYEGDNKEFLRLKKQLTPSRHMIYDPKTNTMEEANIDAHDRAIRQKGRNRRDINLNLEVTRSDVRQRDREIRAENKKDNPNQKYLSTLREMRDRDEKRVEELMDERDAHVDPPHAIRTDMTEDAIKRRLKNADGGTSLGYYENREKGGATDEYGTLESLGLVKISSGIGGTYNRVTTKTRNVRLTKAGRAFLKGTKPKIKRTDAERAADDALPTSGPSKKLQDVTMRTNNGEKVPPSEILDAYSERFPSTTESDMRKFAEVIGLGPSTVDEYLGSKKTGSMIQMQGKLQTGSYVDSFQGTDGAHYASYFLLNDQENLKGWGVTPDSIPRHIASFKGMPFVVTSKKFFANSPYGDVTDHPSTDHFGHLGIKVGSGYGPDWRKKEYNDLMQQAKFQEEFRVGNIEDVFKKSNGDWHALIKIKPEFANYQMPPLVSPALFQLNKDEPQNKITTWVGMHLAGLDESPAYGNNAVYTGSCYGTAGECLTKLSASLSKMDEPFEPCFKSKLHKANLRLAKIRLDLLSAAMMSDDHQSIEHKSLLCKNQSGQSTSCETEDINHEI
jgi:hypothetical protein